MYNEIKMLHLLHTYVLKIGQFFRLNSNMTSDFWIISNPGLNKCFEIYQYRKA